MMSNRFMNPYTDYGFKKLFWAAAIANLNEAQYNAYDRSRMDMWDYNNTIRTAKREGHEAGLEKGRAEGRKEEKKEIALNMKSKGFDVATICQITGLTEDEFNQD